MIAISRPRCPTPCRRASTPTTAGATAPSAQPSTRGWRPIAPPMPPLAPVTRTRQRRSCMNRWYPWRGSGRPAALGRLRCWLSSRRQPSRTGGVRAVNAAGSHARCRVRIARPGTPKVFDRPTHRRAADVAAIGAPTNRTHALAPPSTGLSRPLPETGRGEGRVLDAAARCRRESGQQTAPSRSSFPTRHGRPCPHGSVRPPLPDREEVVPGA